MVRIRPVSLSAITDIYPETLGCKLGEVSNQHLVENEFIRRIKKHQGILHKISFVYADDKWDRQDLRQEIILQLWKSYPSFKGESEFSTWMYRVALNTAITQVRNKKAKSIKYQKYKEKVRTDDTVDYSDDIQMLYRGISHLNRVEKAIILLYLDDKSYKEMAEALGISVKNISVKLVRIKAKLAEIIQKLQKNDEF